MVVISNHQVSETCKNQNIHTYKSLFEKKNRQISAGVTVMMQR
jgi:hypothetical protein